MKAIRSLILTLALALPLPAFADGQPGDIPNTESLLAELLANVDLELMVRIQSAIVNNLEVIGPYSQEYLACLEAEGALNGDQPPTLENLIERARRTGDTCQVILESMFGQMNFDITREEFEQGLSPRYRDLLQQPL